MTSLRAARRRPLAAFPVRAVAPRAIRGSVAAVAAALLFAAGPAGAQVPIPAPALAPGEAVALVGATLHPVSGPPVANGILVWRDGVIAALGADVAVPAGALRVDLAGLHVYPGLIGAQTVTGLVEIGSVRQTSDHTETGKYNPNVRAEVAVNPDSEIIPVTRANGILHVLTIPQGGRISGTSALLRLDGWTWEGMTAAAPVGMHLRWPGHGLNRTPGAKPDADEQRENILKQIAELDAYLDDAAAYAKARAARGEQGIPPSEMDVEREALRPVLAGELPVFVHANGIRQIEAALDWTARRGLRMVLVGGRDAALVAGRLAAADVPVVVGGVHNLPARDWEPYDHPFTLPARLHEAGVRFCIASRGGAAHERSLPFQAATAWSHGLPHDEALRAITLYPARILGVGERLGSLEAGKEATLIVTNGDPLDIRTSVLRAFIAGREIELTSRHTRLWHKYDSRPRAED